MKINNNKKRRATWSKTFLSKEKYKKLKKYNKPRVKQKAQKKKQTHKDLKLT